MKKLIWLLLLAAVAAAIVKIMQSEECAAGSRTAAVKDRVRTATSERIKDPRAVILQTVDDAIADAVTEVSGDAAPSDQEDNA